MVQKSVIKLTKRALMLGFVLMLGAIGLMFFTGEFHGEDTFIAFFVVIASVLAFFYLVWPAANEVGKVLEQREKDKEEDILPDRSNAMMKKSVIKFVKRALILGFVLMLGSIGLMFFSGEFYGEDTLIALFVVVASILAFVYLIWPAAKEAEKVIEVREAEKDEMFP